MPQQIGGGQFGKGLRGVDALRAAMQRRGIDTGILDQVSASAPSGPSPVPPSLPDTNPQVGNIPQQAPSQQVQSQQQFRSPEMEVALKALQGTVKTENKIAEASLGI